MQILYNKKVHKQNSSKLENNDGMQITETFYIMNAYLDHRYSVAPYNLVFVLTNRELQNDVRSDSMGDEHLVKLTQFNINVHKISKPSMYHTTATSRGTDLSRWGGEVLGLLKALHLREHACGSQVWHVQASQYWYTGTSS